MMKQEVILIPGTDRPICFVPVECSVTGTLTMQLNIARLESRDSQILRRRLYIQNNYRNSFRYQIRYSSSTAIPAINKVRAIYVAPVINGNNFQYAPQTKPFTATFNEISEFLDELDIDEYLAKLKLESERLDAHGDRWGAW